MEDSKLISIKAKVSSEEEALAFGSVVETRNVSVPSLDHVACRTRRLDDNTTFKTIELSQEAMLKLGYSFRYHRARGHVHITIERTNDA